MNTQILCNSTDICYLHCNEFGAYSNVIFNCQDEQAQCFTLTTDAASCQITNNPTNNPTSYPTTMNPTSYPTSHPTLPTSMPIATPTNNPTLIPTGEPTLIIFNNTKYPKHDTKRFRKFSTI